MSSKSYQYSVPVVVGDTLAIAGLDERVRETSDNKVPVKILFPLILCLFPALFIVILGPGMLRIVDTLFR